MVVWERKTNFRKLKPEIVSYRKNKNVSNKSFRKINGIKDDNNGFKKFRSIFRKVLNNHAPRKKKYLRGNHSPFINETLTKEIMKRTRLRNEFVEQILSRKEEHRKNCTIQRNYCVNRNEK